MKIRHRESNSYYEVTEAQGKYILIDSKTGSEYSFSNCNDALWKAIEFIRQISLEHLTSSQAADVAAELHVSVETVNALLPSISHLEINKTYYDRLFIKLLASYRMVTTEVVVSNRTNSLVLDEVSNIVRKQYGVSLGLPVVGN